MSNYQRARSPEQKAERMEAIMDATEALFAELSYHEINMGLIAKELGWARSNLYKYASTQEEVFLALHSRASRAYIEDLVNTLEGRELTNAQFAKVWAQVTARHPEFLRYQDILIAIIESNTSLERLVEFKQEWGEMVEPLLHVLQKQVGGNELAMRDLYLRLIYQAPGLYDHFHCADRTAEAMRLAGMQPFTGTFEEAYTDFVLMCLDHAAAV
ncbi:TetR family transcriptional regulator [Anaerotardibacter muris]|uniref:TetR family transcriptional regulator n=1 Tax=Anaerotardibacter muris TaxID=2941505 RepID=UPI0020426668|nr:TetR family transcriptional regulator [Anaerotardibacter muris]